MSELFSSSKNFEQLHRLGLKEDFCFHLRYILEQAEPAWQRQSAIIQNATGRL